CLQESNWSLAF
nr:immunoglobulin light chain junction region [Macaca mulatta]MOV63821.1 immunoglobulin light chain junction region [Macaca mulatta]MOV64057.1 immunoglobulin light chain junction region [Macaca mulatta]MOV64358.1 immunoglobulin light chain junction region [Macaca mulatta]MOV64459.1 immunoglobulin light chain junction region [Macaca mulatta]